MNFLTNLIASFFLTVIVYLVFPIVYRIISGGTTSAKAGTLAFINSIAGFIIFTIIYVAAGTDKVASAPVAFS